jgi:hypothetical protein
VPHIRAPGAWLKGWHPDVLVGQRIAGDCTSRAEDFAAWEAPILYLQPDHDPLAHARDAEAFKHALGDYCEHRARFLAIDPVCCAKANRMLADVALESSLGRIECPVPADRRSA